MQWKVLESEQALPPLEVLQRQLPAAPAGYLGQLLRSGKCRRNGVPLTAGDSLQAGDLLQLPQSRRLQELAKQAPPLVIRHADEELLVADKPAGLPVHRTQSGETNLGDLLQELVRRQGLRCRLAPVTRLDRWTSGLVVFAKGRRSAGTLGRELMARNWKKDYLALVRGRLTGEGTLRQPVSSHGKLRSALAHYQGLQTCAAWSLVNVVLETGRTHQIRLQLAAIGHPLAGDNRYGGPPLPGLSGPFLHCRRLDLARPSGRLVVEAPLPVERAKRLRDLFGDTSDPNPPTVLPTEGGGTG